MELLQNLERLMCMYNMNRSELARACGLSTSTVNSWWNRSCENISLQTLIKLSNHFNITIEELIYGMPSKSFVYDTNEYTSIELIFIQMFADFIKSTREKGYRLDKEMRCDILAKE